ncbi:MAG: hypothetical protein LBC35_02620 [Coriobacteriales bacterium]|jgi:hypothetical protein|nr:hypothetical protein [Coriobacteriales bacterium]
MEFFKSRHTNLSGSNDRELYHKARAIQQAMTAGSRRRPYVRSKFFNRQKVFLDIFWTHLFAKNPGERRRRIALFACVVDLVQNTTYQPEIYVRGNERFYRFFGVSKNGVRFAVQIKQDRKKALYLLSVFQCKKI